MCRSLKTFPIGSGGNYRPLNITRTTGGTASTIIQSEQFETTITGVSPANITAFADRFWTISQPSGAENYTIQIDGTGFTPAGTAVILKGDGTAPTELTKLTAITPNYTTADAVSTFGDFTLGSECLPPTITIQPVADATCELNGTAEFTVTPEAGTYTYAWEVNTGSGWTTVSNGGVYSTATTSTSTLTITNPPFSMNGYAYRAVVTRIDCGGSSTSNGLAILTVNPQPQGSLSANSICKGEEGFLTWTATAGTGPFTVVYNDGTNHTQSGVTSGTHFSVGTHTASKTYTLVSVTDAATCTRNSNFTLGSATVSVNPYITWVGGSGDTDASKRDWQIATNWCGGVPTTTDNVLIPAAPTYQPVISSTGTGYVHSIIIENGASVTVNGAYTFDVSGNITNAGTISMGVGTLTIAVGTIVENVGLIETQNTSAQPLPVSAHYGNSGTIRFNSAVAAQTLFAGTYNDVIVDNPKGVVMAANANVVANGTLEIKSGSKLEIGTGRSVNANTVLNNAGIEGIIIKSEVGQPSGTLIFNNAETNAIQAKVEMYSKASWDKTQPTNYQYKWQFMGIPVQSLDVLPTFYGAYVRRYNQAGKGAGYELTKRWIQLQNADIMEALEGYEIVQPTAKKYEFPGTLYNQSIQKALTYTAGADYPGQHLIGNPYTAAIDIKQIQFGANTQEIVYIYNTGTFASWSQYKASPSADSLAYTPGLYVAVPKNTAGTLALPRQIPSMQAFMVRTSGTLEGSITVNYNAVKQKNFSTQRAKQESLSSMRINLIGASADQDVMWLFSVEGTTRGYDNGWDGPKMAGDAGTARIQAVEGSSTYQIDVVPDINETVISARAGKTDTFYKLRFTSENMMSKYNNLYLLDMYTNAMIDISQSGTEYAFEMTNTSSVERFKILTSAGITTDLKDKLTQFYIVVNKQKIVLNNLTDKDGVLHIYNMNGIEILNTNYGKEKMSEIQNDLMTGVYVYKAIHSNGEVSSGKFTIQ